MKLLLFDIDGTLVLSGGAGVRAMSAAFEKLYGIADAFIGINLAGRTDSSILTDALIQYGLPVHEKTEAEFNKLYAEILPEEFQRNIGAKRIMPGITELLSALERDKEIFLGLLTGNWEVSGRIKLRYFDLDRYFRFGAFSDDSPLRNELLPFAVDRFRKLYARDIYPADIFVIGDTPSDILCARPHGARAVAVAAAHYTIEDLQPFQPDFLFSDLSDTQAVLDIFR